MAQGSFTVTVTPESLCNVIEEMVTHKGIAKSLCAKLRVIDWAQGHGHKHTLLTKILVLAFKLEVRALTPKVISHANAAVLKALVDGLDD
jgi:hypothetical protein